jgi:hypothetical protein
MTSTHPGGRADAAGPERDDAHDIELSLRDPARFGVIFDRYFAEIHGYAAKRAGRDVADDIAAETFLTAFRARRRFDAGRGSVKAWLYGIVTNHLSVYRRRELRAYRAVARSGVPAPEEGHAALPGIRSLGTLTDASGQRGAAVAYTAKYANCGNGIPLDEGASPYRVLFTSCTVQQILVIDPATGLPQAEELRYTELPPGQQWTAPRGLFSYEIFGPSHWTSHRPPGSSQ